MEIPSLPGSSITSSYAFTVSGIMVLMLSYLLSVSWQSHTVVSDHTVSNLSYLLPIRWRCLVAVVCGWFVITDHTVSNLSPTTSNHTTIMHPLNILVGLGQNFIQQRWSENPELARIIHFISTHSGTIVLMLSHLLSVSWQCHTVSNLPPTAPNHTTVINPFHPT